MYLVIQSVISAIVLIIYAHCLFCTCSFPLYTHTHYGRVLTTLGLHVQLLDGCSNVQMFDETVRLARSLGPLPLILVYLHFILDIILRFLYITFDFYSAVIFFPLFIAIMCGLICITAVFMIIMLPIYSLFWLQFRLSAYTRGILPRVYASP